MNNQVWQRLFSTIASIGVSPTDDESMRLRKAVVVFTVMLALITLVVLVLIYVLNGEYLAAAPPFIYAIISGIQLIVLRRTQQWRLFRFIQTILGVGSPFIVMLALGGYQNGSAVIIWAFITPVIVLLSWGSRPAIYTFITFLATLVIAAFLTPFLRTENNLSAGVITAFYVFNIGTVSTIAFITLIYFVRQQELALELMRRNRELERANMEQELLLRQSEKLATLGRLSAGVAHELNNPAAAVQRGIVQLGDYMGQLEQAQVQLRKMDLSEAQETVLETFDQSVQERAQSDHTLDPLERSDLEYEIENHLEEKGLDNAWKVAPTLVEMRYDMGDVQRLSKQFTPTQFPTIVASLSNRHATENLIQEIGHSAGRISEIVRALKTYTYLDQAPIQFLNVHEGLENTLVMLRSKLKKGVTVHREFAQNLPDVQGYGSELNQVWTNIIDNAIEAMDGKGEIWLRTRHEGGWVFVEIADNGQGIPADVKPHIFDPFYTTKELGKGTGLGLNISQNIVVQQHGGEISVDSQPGRTTFIVKLPLELPGQDEAA